VARRFETVSSEVAPAVEVLGGIRSGKLIKRNALRSWVDQLDGRSVWNTKACSNFHAAVLQLDDSPIEVWHTEKEDGLIAMEMLGEQYRRRIRIQANHGHSGPEGLNGENQLGAQSSGEVLDIGRDVTAWEIDKLQSAEHNLQATLLRGSVLALLPNNETRRVPILIIDIRQKVTRGRRGESCRVGE
jgi:hypothetical protein